jgi:hypothetical protein
MEAIKKAQEEMAKKAMAELCLKMKKEEEEAKANIVEINDKIKNMD